MDLDVLADYIAVVEHGSILAAAEATGTTQPTLSRRIRELEDSLGVLLLDRTSRGVRPTVYGEAFRLRAEALLRERQAALDELRALKNGSSGHARIGLAPALSGYLPPALVRLADATPDATFEVVEGTYDALVARAVKGEIDGAFTMLPPGESVEALAVRTLDAEPLVVVATATHPLAGAGPLPLERLGEHRWILMNRPRSILEAFQHFASTAGVTSPRIALETSSLDFLKAMLRQAPLLSAVPRGAVDAELEDGSLAALELDGLPLVPTAFVHRHGVLPPLLLDLVREVEAVRRARGTAGYTSRA